MSRVALTVQDEIERADAQWLSQSDEGVYSISAMDLLDVSEAPMDTSLDAVVSRMRPWPPLRPPSSSAKRAHEITPEGTHPGAPRPEGHQKNDFVLCLIDPPKIREKTSRNGKKVSTLEVEYGPRQRWALDPDIDRDTRKVCEAS